MSRLLDLKVVLALTLLALASVLALTPLQAQAPYHRFRPRTPHRQPSGRHALPRGRGTPR